VITVVGAPAFPEHEFFTPGRVFACRLRHANASFYDDAASQVRACSLKFADADFDSPLDIIMNTGVIQAFWSFDTFMQFADSRVKSREHDWHPQREYMRLLPGGMVGAIESERQAPTSYAEMLYHTSIVYPFQANDGRTRYAKYRLVPLGLKQESGLPDLQKQREPWVQSRRPDDPHPRQYLQAEYRQRLQSGAVEYQLQIQLREFIEDRDTWEFFNGGRVWDPATWPWLDLAIVRATESMPDAQTELTRFWLGHQPPSLGLTWAYSPVDYRSLAWVRYQLYPWSRRASSLLRTLGCQRRLRSDF
jgi:arachidonate 5-lipoxygenase